MRVYTRTGDEGKTSLASGNRVPKYHERLACYGTIEELNSCVGWVLSKVIDPKAKTLLVKIQNRLFTISSNLAMDKEEFKLGLPQITPADIEELEQDMDRMLDLLPELKSFILPGGSEAISVCHVARTVCRRAERIMVKLAENVAIDPHQIKYVKP